MVHKENIIKAHIISPDGLCLAIELKSFKESFPQLQQIIGGYVELVAVLFQDKSATLVVNEEGSLHATPLNTRATAIYWTATITKITRVHFNPLTDPCIYGTAVLIECDKYSL